MLGRLLKHRYAAGDTIIEVLVAVTVFSVIAVGAVSVMNQGAATAQRSLEITLVRQEIDAQAEALRFLNAAYISEYIKDMPKDDSHYSKPALAWTEIPVGALISKFGVSDDNKCLAVPNNGFVINNRVIDDPIQLIKNAPLDPLSSVTYSKINYNNSSDINAITSIDGIWVEAIKAKDIKNPDNLGYIDFHIRACWDGFGQVRPMTLGTIVRLYEPI